MLSFTLGRMINVKDNIMEKLVLIVHFMRQMNVITPDRGVTAYKLKQYLPFSVQTVYAYLNRHPQYFEYEEIEHRPNVMKRMYRLSNIGHAYSELTLGIFLQYQRECVERLKYDLS